MDGFLDVSVKRALSLGGMRAFKGLPGNNRYNVTLTLKSKEFSKITVTLTVTCYG
jgi:hypothetical protein